MYADSDHSSIFWKDTKITWNLLMLEWADVVFLFCDVCLIYMRQITYSLIQVDSETNCPASGIDE